MRTLRFIIALVIIAGASIALYFWFEDEKEDQPLQGFLNDQAALYHRYNEASVMKLAGFTGDNNADFELSKLIPANSLLYKYVAGDSALVSWHLTRQESLEPVVWVVVGEDYDIISDSVFSGKSFDRLLEVKINDEKVFITRGHNYLALGNSGELMDFISDFRFKSVSFINDMPMNKLKGSVKPAVSYIKSRFRDFSEIPLTGKAYELNYYVNNNRVFFNGSIDSIPLHCNEYKPVAFNKALPSSAIAAWQYGFNENSCLTGILPDSLQSTLWDAEDRYQFKFKNILDAWFEGTIVYFNSQLASGRETFAACKLKSDAAPFASGSRFFTDYRTINLEKENPRKSFTIAKMLPDQLSKIVFPGIPGNHKLYVSQVHEWLYFSQNKTALLLVINELVNDKRKSGFSGHKDAIGAVFFHFPDILKKYGDDANNEEPDTEQKKSGFEVKAKFIPYESGIYFQGSVY